MDRGRRPSQAAKPLLCLPCHILKSSGRTFERIHSRTSSASLSSHRRRPLTLERVHSNPGIHSLSAIKSMNAMNVSREVDLVLKPDAGLIVTERKQAYYLTPTVALLTGYAGTFHRSLP